MLQSIKERTEDWGMALPKPQNQANSTNAYFSYVLTNYVLTNYVPINNVSPSHASSTYAPPLPPCPQTNPGTSS